MSTTKKMTIIEAISKVLQNENLTVDEIYFSIVDKELYKFGAKNPKGVVNGEIRRHCIDLNFPTAHPIKYFCIKSVKNGKPVFGLLNNKKDKIVQKTPDFNDEDDLPEEKVEKAVDQYNSKIKIELMKKIMQNESEFFEKLVVELLLKMGYGYDNNSGAVVGKSHDGGIDGIINEDKLGLDRIYIQAKRYFSDNKVSRPILQSFVGAMEGVQKGVFLTTSTFTKDGIEYISKLQHKNIKLIDGELLLNYMVKYEVGVQVLKTYRIMKIDEDYFVQV